MDSRKVDEYKLTDSQNKTRCVQADGFSGKLMQYELMDSQKTDDAYQDNGFTEKLVSTR